MPYNKYYQYETNPKKIEPEYETIKSKYPKKRTSKRITKAEQARRNKIMQRKIICYIAICFTALFIISYRYSMIDDTYAELKQEQANLAELEKQTTQMEANIESSINLTKIEEEAEEQLGMQKLSAEQTVYVVLPKTDHIEATSKEVTSSDLKENWLIEIVNKIIENFKQ